MRELASNSDIPAQKTGWMLRREADRAVLAPDTGAEGMMRDCLGNGEDIFQIAGELCLLAEFLCA
jgi:hypothetical protein